jgi:hypothetical protein
MREEFVAHVVPMSRDTLENPAHQKPENPRTTIPRSGELWERQLRDREPLVRSSTAKPSTCSAGQMDGSAR